MYLEILKAPGEQTSPLHTTKKQTHKMLNVIRIYLPDPKYVAAAKVKASKNICFQLDILNLDT